MTIEIIYHDLLSGRAQVPLLVHTVEDPDGFSSEKISLKRDIRIVLDNGHKLSFPAGTDINDVSGKSEIVNELLDIQDPSEIVVFDDTYTIKTTQVKLQGGGFYEGFQEWWFIHRVIKKKSRQYLRFNLEVDTEDGDKLFFPASTRWTECVRSLESRHLKDVPKFEKKDFETVSGMRRCYSPTVPTMNPNEPPEDLLQDIGDILADD